jgi:hypothetical protein
VIKHRLDTGAFPSSSAGFSYEKGVKHENRDNGARTYEELAENSSKRGRAISAPLSLRKGDGKGK